MSHSLNQSSHNISKQLNQQFEMTSDFEKRIIFKGKISIFYLNTIVDKDQIQSYIIEPLQQSCETNNENKLSIKQIKTIINSASLKETNSVEEIKHALVKGSTFLFIEEKTMDYLYLQLNGSNED
ncbi:spore germination protein [Priestia sp. OVL9]|nr:spore germination protein [Priestia sp. OVL9]MCJ7988059.1 spore germination protein [Priestia sp. OVL9]